MALEGATRRRAAAAAQVSEDDVDVVTQVSEDDVDVVTQASEDDVDVDVVAQVSEVDVGAQVSEDDVDVGAQVSEGPITPPEVRQVHQIGDNITCKWGPRQWFLAQVTGFDNGKYSVYFLCGKTKHNVPSSHIRPSDSRYPRRHDMVGKDFYFPAGAPDLPEGRFRVTQILEDKNFYRCARVTGNPSTKVEDFDIGYVVKEYVKGVDKSRELGHGEVLSTTRRNRSRVVGGR